MYILLRFCFSHFFCLGKSLRKDAILNQSVWAVFEEQKGIERVNTGENVLKCEKCFSEITISIISTEGVILFLQ